MAVPIQLTTNVQNETFGGVTYHIEGELVPALHLELSHTGVYFEHHILLWKDPAVQIALHPMKGGFKRMLAGMPFLLLVGAAPNAIAYESKQFSSGLFFLAGVPASVLLMGVLGLFVWLIWPLMGMPVLVE